MTPFGSSERSGRAGARASARAAERARGPRPSVPPLPRHHPETRPAPPAPVPDRIPDRLAGHVRVRVGALLFDDPAAPAAVLLAEHGGLWEDRPFWTPPGGGVEFGEPLADALRREVSEETGLSVEVDEVRYVLDFVRPPLHAVSFYLECTADDLGRMRLGADPELGDRQILRGVRMVPLDELPALTVYPEPFAHRLAADARAGFPDGTAYLGTFR